MKKNLNLKQTHKEINKKYLAIIILLSILILALLITGATLMGVGYENFSVYAKLMSWSNANNIDFSEALKTYNSNVTSSNEWTKASIDLFAPGLTLLLISFVTIGLTTWYGIKNKNKKAL